MPVGPADWGSKRAWGGWSGSRYAPGREGPVEPGARCPRDMCSRRYEYHLNVKLASRYTQSVWFVAPFFLFSRNLVRFSLLSASAGSTAGNPPASKSTQKATNKCAKAGATSVRNRLKKKTVYESESDFMEKDADTSQPSLPWESKFRRNFEGLLVAPPTDTSSR